MILIILILLLIMLIPMKIMEDTMLLEEIHHLLMDSELVLEKKMDLAEDLEINR